MILQIGKGNYYAQSVTFQDLDGNDILIDGKTILFTAKSYDDELSDNTGAAITYTTTGSGYGFEFVLTPTQTNITTGVYKADFKIYTNANDPTNTEPFEIEIVDTVTK